MYQHWHTADTVLSIYLSIRFYNTCRRLPETKRHSSLSLHWSCSRFLVVMATWTPSINVFLGLPLSLLSCGIHSMISFGILSSGILLTWPYHTSRNKYIEKNLCITLVIYQESLHDARSTKCKNHGCCLFVCLFTYLLSYYPHAHHTTDHHNSHPPLNQTTGTSHNHWLILPNHKVK